MQYETKADKIDILKCLKHNCMRTGRSMIMVKATDVPKRYVIYILEGFINQTDHERMQDDLQHCEVPFKERCVASIKMFFGPPYIVEFNWEIDFKKCQAAMLFISDSMVLTEYTSDPKKMDEDEYSKGVFKVSFSMLKEMELFIPFGEYDEEKKAALLGNRKPAKNVKKASKNSKNSTVIVPHGKTPILQYKRKNKNARKKTKPVRVING